MTNTHKESEENKKIQDILNRLPDFHEDKENIKRFNKDIFLKIVGIIGIILLIILILAIISPTAFV